MTQVIGDTELWSKNAKGVDEGTPGRELFKQQAATLLSTMSFRIMFTSSRVGDDGQLSEGTLDLDADKENYITVPNYDGFILVENDKITNLYNPDGTVNDETLRLCFAKLETVPIVSLKDPDSNSLHERFHATTGRDRLLDFMARKTRAANEPQYDEWRAQARRSLQEALKKEAAQKRASRDGALPKPANNAGPA